LAGLFDILLRYVHERDISRNVSLNQNTGRLIDRNNVVILIENPEVFRSEDTVRE
jgi:hypothetical protein